MTDLSADDVIQGYEHASRELWTRTAPTYVDGAEALTTQAAETLLDAAGVGRGTALLDVGTGPGTVLAPALRRNALVHAIDLTPAMVEVARRRFPDVDIRVGNAVTLPYDDATFDAVTFAFSLHHMAQPVRALAEARRVLRPGGRVSLTVWAPAESLEAFGVALAALPALGVDLGAPLALPLDTMTPAEYLRLLDSAGLDAPSVRRLDIAWEVRDAAPIVDLFERYLGLAAYGESVQAKFAAAVEQAVKARQNTSHSVRLPNPAILASARRPA